MALEEERQKQEQEHSGSLSHYREVIISPRILDKILIETFAGFLNETDAKEHLQPTADLPQNAGQLDQSESKFPQYEFLNLHGSHSYTEASRTAARAHVMRHVVKEKEARKAFLAKQLIPTSQRLNLSNHIAGDLYATNVSGSMMMTESRSEPIRSFATASSNDTGYYYYHTARELTTSHATGLTGNHITLEHLPNVEIAPMQSPSPLSTSILPSSTQRREVELIHHCKLIQTWHCSRYGQTYTCVC